LFLGDHGLHFLCCSLGAVGAFEFGAFGSVGAAIDQFMTSGAWPAVTESDLAQVALAHAGSESFSIAVGSVELLVRSFWTGSKIVHSGGQKLVVWNPGFSGRFRDEAKAWAAKMSVRCEGL
jgi:hypothetical protein